MPPPRHDQYKYSPLPSNSIRLLKIHPTTIVKYGGWDGLTPDYEDEEELNISLETFELSKCPPYAVLSYTWGLPNSLEEPEPSIFT